MITADIIRHYREAIIEIARRHGARNVRIFGSVARGEAGASSDLDLIVQFDPDVSLFDHGALVIELRELLGVEVDVISEKGMKKRFREHVLQEAIPL